MPQVIIRGAVDDTTMILNEHSDIQISLAIRSLAYSKLGKRDEAISDMTKILEILPQDATWYHNRALNYQVKGKIPEAIDDYKNCIKYADDDNLKNLCETALAGLK
jgi:tetratricopeptide (TPR) repeat protein